MVEFGIGGVEDKDSYWVEEKRCVTCTYGWLKHMIHGVRYLCIVFQHRRHLEQYLSFVQ